MGRRKLNTKTAFEWFAAETKMTENVNRKANAMKESKIGGALLGKARKRMGSPNIRKETDGYKEV